MAADVSKQLERAKKFLEKNRVEDAIEAVAPLAEEKQTEIRLVAPGGYFEADVDARRIRRILQNLLGNAIDHGEGLPIDDVVAFARDVPNLRGYRMKALRHTARFLRRHYRNLSPLQLTA